MKLSTNFRITKLCDRNFNREVVRVCSDAVKKQKGRPCGRPDIMVLRMRGGFYFESNVIHCSKAVRNLRRKVAELSVSRSPLAVGVPEASVMPVVALK